MQASCATPLSDADGMCPAIARFANASPVGASRTVSLTIDWGGVFSSSDVMFEKSCLRGSDRAEKALCSYPLENTSTEFAAVNYRRALSCIGQGSEGVSPTDDDSLPPRASSSFVNGKSVRSRVTIEFARGTKDRPPKLSISTGESINVDEVRPNTLLERTRDR